MTLFQILTRRVATGKTKITQALLKRLHREACGKRRHRRSKRRRRKHGGLRRACCLLPLSIGRPAPID